MSDDKAVTLNGRANGHSPAKQPLLVIGAGCGRTGTNSLKVALEIIYNRPCLHGFDAVKLEPRIIDRLNEIGERLKLDPDLELAESDLLTLYDSYACGTDLPTSWLVFQLIRIYPECKVILTVRDTNEWLRSMRETFVLHNSPLFSNSLLDRIASRLILGRGVERLVRQSFELMINRNMDSVSDNDMKAGFEAWNKRVIAQVPHERLLVFNVKSGWPELCRFLGVPIPNQPFPFVNDRQSMKAFMATLRHSKRLFKSTVYSSIALTSVLTGWYLSRWMT